MLFLENGVSLSQLGVLQLAAVPFKSMGYVAWAFAADIFGLKTALLLSLILSTMSLELFRHQLLYSWVGFVIMGKIVRTSLNAAWPLVDSYAGKCQFSNVPEYALIRVGKQLKLPEVRNMVVFDYGAHCHGGRLVCWWAMCWIISMHDSATTQSLA